MQRGNQRDIEEEIGDLVFVCTNLGRKLKVDVEASTRAGKFQIRKTFPLYRNET